VVALPIQPDDGKHFLSALRRCGKRAAGNSGREREVLEDCARVEEPVVLEDAADPLPQFW
jgi:hypothetical protein